MEKINIVIYEDKTDVRETLEELLNLHPDFIVGGAFYNCDEVEQNMKNIAPQIVIMDKDMPETDGIEGLIRIKSKFPEVDVVMYTDYETDEDIFKCLQNGASGYIRKGVRHNRIINTILAVIGKGEGEGEIFSPSVAKKILKFFTEGFPLNDDYDLTPREKETLNLLCAGYSQKMVADKMKITINGVNKHQQNIFKKLQVHCATEAVSKAIRERLVRLNLVKK